MLYLNITTCARFKTRFYNQTFDEEVGKNSEFDFDVI